MASQQTYDYIVAGAGAAGCVVANRLSADPDRSVLVLEAGGSDDSFQATHLVGIPSLFMLWGPETDWGYSTEPSPAASGRGIPITQGKVLGGGSSTNGRIFLRGNRRNYDRWESLGNEGWGYADVLPYFKKLENFSGGASEYHGADGPMTVIELPDPTPISRAFKQACVDYGFADTDVNGAQQENAVDFCQSTTTPDLHRASTAVAYLHPVTDRPNLTVKTGATITRILFEGTRAVGVEFVEDGQVNQARADSEVISCLGGFNEPRMLQLSGIGPADHLRSHGIDVVADLPGVGENLQDHLLVRMSWHLKELQPAPIILSEVNLFTYSRSDHADVAPDLQYMFAPFFFPEYGDVDKGITLVPVIAQPKSRGTVRLRSNDPTDPPVISMNYLSAPEDVDVLVSGLELGFELMSSSLMDEFKGEEVAPGPKIKTDEERRQYIRDTAVTVWHPSCTCKMGTDDMSVVDSQLRVRGVEGLRVVDCSVMPEIVNSNLQATVIMIGEKASDMILNGK
jgi:choline dehydrogenase